MLKNVHAVDLLCTMNGKQRRHDCSKTRQLLCFQMNKGGKFLKKLWCCVSRRVQHGNLVLSTELIT